MLVVITNTVFGENICHLRNKYKISQWTLAKLIGLPRHYLAMVESCQWPAAGIEFPGKALSRMAHVFDLDMNFLMTVSLRESFQEQK